MFKRIISFFFTLMMGFILLAGYTSFVYADSEIKVIVDGRQISFDQPPINENGRVMVPIRFVAEAMGWEVIVGLEYDPEGVIRIQKNMDTELYTIRCSTFIDVEDAKINKVISCGSVIKLDEIKDMSPTLKIVNGRTLIGVRDLAEALYAQVEWDSTTQSVIISTQPLPYSDGSADVQKVEIPDSLKNSSETANTGHELDTEDKQEVEDQTQENSETDDVQQQEEFELEVVRLVNAERVAAGLLEVKINHELMAVARWKAEEMDELEYFSHTSPTRNLSHAELVRSFGIDCDYAGENITQKVISVGSWSSSVKMDPSEAMQSWMNSSGHKANILKAKATHIGVGYCNGNWSLFMMY